MKILAVTGFSNSGKTTLIVELIKHCVARGDRVAAIKHTHHEVTDIDGGDTGRFQAAGASTVILTHVEAIRLIGGLDQLDADVVLIEGFKSFYGWPRIEAPAALADALAILDRIADP